MLLLMERSSLFLEDDEFPVRDLLLPSVTVGEIEMVVGTLPQRSVVYMESLDSNVMG